MTVDSFGWLLQCEFVIFPWSFHLIPMSFYIYIYIYAFSRRFYPKQLTVHSSYSFYILSVLAFPGNRTHDLGVANAMLYQLSYRKAQQSFSLFSFQISLAGSTISPIDSHETLIGPMTSLSDVLVSVFIHEVNPSGRTSV